MEIMVYRHNVTDYEGGTHCYRFTFEPVNSEVVPWISPATGEEGPISMSITESEVWAKITGLPEGSRVAESWSGEKYLYIPGSDRGITPHEAAHGYTLKGVAPNARVVAVHPAIYAAAAKG